MIYITISKADAFAREWWKEPENVNAGAAKWSENTKKEGKTGHDGEKDKYLTGKMERELQKMRQNPPIFQKSYKNGGNL